jgi:hypothetical protein
MFSRSFCSNECLETSNAPDEETTETPERKDSEESAKLLSISENFNLSTDENLEDGSSGEPISNLCLSMQKQIISR